MEILVGRSLALHVDAKGQRFFIIILISQLTQILKLPSYNSKFQEMMHFRVYDVGGIVSGLPKFSRLACS